MNEKKSNTFILPVKKWLENVVIAYNFCPFAKGEFINETIRYSLFFEKDDSTIEDYILNEIRMLSKFPEIETSLLILPNSYQNFEDYLDLLEVANELLEEFDFLGIFQIASFHPNYQFGGTEPNDPSNFTNRSPYPILHILREESLSRVIDAHGNTESIPQRNIEFCNEKGLEYMENLFKSLK